MPICNCLLFDSQVMNLFTKKQIGCSCPGLWRRTVVRLGFDLLKDPYL
jgi:hypothetical protein